MLVLFCVSGLIHVISIPFPYTACITCIYIFDIQYLHPGGSLAPHIDLSRIIDHRLACHQADNDNKTATLIDQARPVPTRSTHTFILYLCDAEHGGATNILRKVPGKRCEFVGDENVIRSVKPRRGRLLVCVNQPLSFD